MSAEPLSPGPPRAVDRALFRQSWHDLVLLHWPVPPGRVAHLFPSGTRPDELDGHTYVGLVFFEMRDLGLGAGPAFPAVGRFTEVNVRLYSVDEQGRRGVVFLSLDCSMLLPTLAARGGWGLPYHWAEARRLAFDDRLLYTVRRRRPGGPRSRVWVATGRQIRADDTASTFLTARWGLHARARGRTYYWPVEHEPWGFRQVSLLSLDDSLVGSAIGTRVTEAGVASVLYSPGLRVRFGVPRRVDAPPGPTGDEGRPPGGPGA
ncbi:YqjF family protein [Streptomyces sp. cmx-4-7]|uniref:YqjF family protein n=1 Tax=Streptomyces sp. cmx-4-7 TaxID=2790939 RepID=UPI003980BA00